MTAAVAPRPVPTRPARRPLDAWKVRFCPSCLKYEVDAGPPRGFVELRGGPTGAMLEFLDATRRANG